MTSKGGKVNASPIHDDELTARVVEAVLGWKASPDRFIKPGRSWTPRSRFKPLNRLEDAFLLLDSAGCKFVLSVGSNGVFAAEVRIGDRTGNATGESKARTITLAICRVLGIGAA